MKDLDYALTHTHAVYDALFEVAPFQRARLREKFLRQCPLKPSRLDVERSVIKAMANSNLLRIAVCWVKSPRETYRRTSPVEKIKNRTHGFEHAGQVSGGNFGTSF
jgi:hypothetical protein